MQSADTRAHLRRSSTYPGVLPFLHLDHIYYDPVLRLEKLALCRTSKALLASDHLPLIVDFQKGAVAMEGKEAAREAAPLAQKENGPKCPDSQLCSPPACTALNNATLERQAYLPFHSPISDFADTGSKLQSTLQLSPGRDWMLVTAFRSPATVAAFTASIPGSTFLACYFASAPIDSAARSIFGSATGPRFAPRPAASTLQTRCSFFD